MSKYQHSSVKTHLSESDVFLPLDETKASRVVIVTGCRSDGGSERWTETLLEPAELLNKKPSIWWVQENRRIA